LNLLFSVLPPDSYRDTPWDNFVEKGCKYKNLLKPNEKNIFFLPLFRL